MPMIGALPLTHFWWWSMTGEKTLNWSGGQNDATVSNDGNDW